MAVPIYKYLMFRSGDALPIYDVTGLQEIPATDTMYMLAAINSAYATYMRNNPEYTTRFTLRNGNYVVVTFEYDTSVYVRDIVVFSFYTESGTLLYTESVTYTESSGGSNGAEFLYYDRNHDLYKFEGSHHSDFGATEVLQGGLMPNAQAKFTHGCPVYRTNPQLYEWLKTWIDGSLSSDDPYAPAGESGTGGGNGTFTDQDTPTGIPSLPSGASVVSTGFIKLFRPSEQELRNLASYMWTNPAFDLTNWRAIFANPMDAILGLSILPVDPQGGTPTAITVGNISTNVTMTPAVNNRVEVDCGSITVSEYSNGYLDYSPYSKVDIYLPYVGIRTLNTDDVMNKTIKVKYNVDVMSGAFTCFVAVYNTEDAEYEVYYTFSGCCAASVPICGRDFTNMLNGVLSIGATVAGVAASGGLAAPMALTAAASTAANISSMKPDIQRSGSMSGVAGLMGGQTPYLIRTRPRLCRPKQQNKYTGYPSFVTAKLSTLSGFTSVESIHLENMTGTDTEIAEIDRLLKEGVII